MQRGEAPVARGLFISVDAQYVCQLHELCVCEACDLEAAVVARQHMLQPLALSGEAGLVVPVMCKGQHDEHVEP